MSLPIPLDDPTRTSLLVATGLLDPAPAEAFDRVTALTARLLNAPISLVSVVVHDRQFFKSAVGLEFRETPIEQSLCQYVVADNRPLLINDGPHDPQYSSHPAVTQLGLRAYLGAPLRTRDGQILGSLCVADAKPRAWNESDVALVSQLAEIVMTEVELRREIQHRTRLSRELQEQMTLLEAIFGGTTDALYVKDLSGRYLLANEAGARLCGRSRTDVVGRTDAELWPASVAESQAAGDARVLAEGKSEDVDEQFDTKEGPAMFATTKGVWRGPDGRPAGLFIIRRSITERIAAAAERDLLAEIMRTSIGAICVLNPEGHILFTNDRAESILGVRAKEIPGRTYDALTWRHTTLDGRPLPDAEQPFSIVMRTGQPVFDVRHAIEWSDGRRRALSINGAPVKNARNEITRLVFLVTDITDLLATEAAARAAAEKFSKAFRASPDPLCITRRRDGIIVEVNEGFVRLFGHRVEEVVGRTTTEIGLWADLANRDDVLRRLASQPNLRDYEVTLLDSAGRPIEFLLCCETFEIAGEPHLIAIGRDITDERIAQSERQSLEAQLWQVQKMEAIGTLAGGIAHDFNNLLTGILGHADLARLELPEGHPATLNLDAIAEGGRRASNLVGQLLTFSRRNEHSRTSVDMALVVAEAMRLLRASLPTGIEIKTTLADPGPTVLADAGQIHQVVMNLGTNAAHAMGERGLLAVRLEETLVDGEFAERHLDLPRGRCAHFSLRDTGHGMDGATLSRIFTPFFTTKPIGQGTGLGLAVVHGIVKGHEGGIWVESEPGQGTTFHIFLPVRAAPAASGTAPPAPSTVARGQGELILVIEDEPFVASYAAASLQQLGYTVATYTDSFSALADFAERAEEFRLVITDYMMPGLTGGEVIRRIQEMRPGIPVILATGYAAGIKPDSAQQIGACELLQKPFALEALAAAVRRHLPAGSAS
jgi:PAS domain S-box-containing protein